jgi:hypothetical protein
MPLTPLGNKGLRRLTFGEDPYPSRGRDSLAVPTASDSRRSLGRLQRRLSGSRQSPGSPKEPPDTGMTHPRRRPPGPTRLRTFRSAKRKRHPTRPFQFFKELSLAKPPPTSEFFSPRRTVAPLSRNDDAFRDLWPLWSISLQALGTANFLCPNATTANQRNAFVDQGAKLDISPTKPPHIAGTREPFDSRRQPR